MVWAALFVGILAGGGLDFGGLDSSGLDVGDFVGEAFVVEA